MPDSDMITMLLGRTVAFDMLLRTIYAQWAAGASDPEQFVFTTIESIIGSMDEVTVRPQSEAEQRIWEHAQVELEAFAKNVCLRLSAVPPGQLPERPLTEARLAEHGPALVSAINQALRNGAQLHLR